MQSQPQVEIKEVWVRVLKKGIITLPKAMREKSGIKEGDVAKVKLIGNNIVIEPREALYEGRSFSDEDIARWVKEDELPARESDKIKRSE